MIDNLIQCHPEPGQKTIKIKMLLDIENYDLRDIRDLFEFISEIEENFQDNHKTIIEISKRFIEYYVENAEKLLQIMRPSALHTVKK